MEPIRRYARIAVIGYFIALSVFAAGLWGLHRYGYAWAAKLDHDSWAARGTDYLLRGKEQGARQEFRALLAVHPESPTGWAGLIESYYLSPHKQEVILEVAQQARAALKETHPTIGDLLYAQRRFYTNAGVPYEENKVAKEVEEILDSIEARGVLPAEGWYLRSQIAFDNGLAKEFVEALKQLAKAPLEDSSDIYLRQREKALAQLQAESESIAIMTILRAHMVLGEWDRIRDAVSAREGGPGTSILYIRGIVEEVEGDITNAIKLYSRASLPSSNLLDGQHQALNRLHEQHGNDI